MYNNLKPDTMYEFILNHLWEAWTVVALLFLAAEVAAGDFFMTCFAVGAALSGGSRNLVGIAIQLSDSEEEEFFVGYPMLISPEKFDFGIE